MGLKDAHELQVQLNCLDQRIFPLLYTQRYEYRAQIEADSLKETQLQKSMKLIFGKTGMEFTFGHEMSLSLQNVNTSDKREFRSNLLKENEQCELKEMPALKKLKELDYDDTNVYPKILFLGELSVF